MNDLINQISDFINNKNDLQIKQLLLQNNCDHAWNEFGMGFYCKKCDFYTGLNSYLNALITKVLWYKNLTPESDTNDLMQRALDWWHLLPIQNLKNMDNSWVGYLWKYYPNELHPYHLTGEQVLHIYNNEHPTNR